MFRSKSIKIKILFPVLCIAIIGFLALSLSGYIISKNAITEDIAEIDTTKVNKLVNFAEGKLEKWKSEIEIISKADAIKQSFLAGNISIMNKFLAERKNILVGYEMFYTADKKGNFKSSVGLNGNVADRDYFERVMKGETVISDPVISKASGKPIICIVSPIKDDAGKVVGLFGGTMQLTYISEIINQEKFGKTGYAFMLDEQGLIMAYPDEKQVLVKNMIKEESQTLAEIAKKMIAGGSGSGEYTYQGVSKISAFAPIKSTGWSIAVSAPKNEIFGKITTLGMVFLIGSVVILILITVVMIFAVSVAIKPLLKMVEITKSVAEGNLAVEVNYNSQDEIGRMGAALKKMIENLKDMINKIRESAAMVASTAEQASATTQQIASSSENQSAAAEQTLSSMEELDASIQNISQNVQEVSVNVNQVSSLIGQMEKMMEEVTIIAEKVYTQSENSIKATNVGREAVDKSKEGMDEIDKAVNNLVTVIKGLGRSAVDIGEIVDVIDDIAEQTNLLALNAAIEAARAGEHGRGFAVVAGAVRNLAEKSGDATKEITKLIRGIQEEVNSAVETAKEGAEQVEQGVKLAGDAGEALQTIKQAVEQTAKEAMSAKDLMESQNKQIKEVAKVSGNVNELANTMAATVEQQTAASSEVVRAVENISESASQIASGTGEIASSSDVLAKEAQDLTSIISNFKLD